MGFRRALINATQSLSGARVARPQNLGYALEQTHLQRFLSYFEVDCVFDVGANAGQYVERLLERSGFAGHVVSFEPIPEMVALLRRKKEKFPNWHIEPIALSDTEGEAAFNVMESDQFSSLLAPQGDEYGALDRPNTVVRSISVTTSTLRSEFLKYRQRLGFKRPFLKLDTQGSEMLIVQAAGETIHEFVGLQSELAVKRLYRGAPYYDEAIAFYQSKGFELSALISTNGWWHFPHLVEVDCIMFRTSALPAAAAQPQRTLGARG